MEEFKVAELWKRTPRLTLRATQALFWTAVGIILTAIAIAAIEFSCPDLPFTASVTSIRLFEGGLALVIAVVCRLLFFLDRRLMIKKLIARNSCLEGEFEMLIEIDYEIMITANSIRPKNEEAAKQQADTLGTLRQWKTQVLQESAERRRQVIRCANHPCRRPVGLIPRVFRETYIVCPKCCRKLERQHRHLEKLEGHNSRPYHFPRAA